MWTIGATVSLYAEAGLRLAFSISVIIDSEGGFGYSIAPAVGGGTVAGGISFSLSYTNANCGSELSGTGFETGTSVSIGPVTPSIEYISGAKESGSWSGVNVSLVDAGKAIPYLNLLNLIPFEYHSEVSFTGYRPFEGVAADWFRERILSQLLKLTEGLPMDTMRRIEEQLGISCDDFINSYIKD